MPSHVYMYVYVSKMAQFNLRNRFVATYYVPIMVWSNALDSWVGGYYHHALCYIRACNIYIAKLTFFTF